MLVRFSGCLPSSFEEGEIGLSGDKLSLPEEASDPALFFLIGR